MKRRLLFIATGEGLATLLLADPAMAQDGTSIDG